MLKYLFKGHRNVLDLIFPFFENRPRCQRNIALAMDDFPKIKGVRGFLQTPLTHCMDRYNFSFYVDDEEEEEEERPFLGSVTNDELFGDY